MPHAYTVDRQWRLAKGDVLDLVVHSDVTPRFLQSHLDDLFPDGVTQHGDSYFVSNAGATIASPNIELIFEYVRRAHFEFAPSRFQSVFGFESIDDAEAFRADPRWGSSDGSIWDVQTDQAPFCADMMCLSLQSSILVASQMAHLYWSHESNRIGDLPGGSSVPPLWELLLTPPVRVVARVA